MANEGAPSTGGLRRLTVRELDATFSVVREVDSTFIYFESRGPGRNVDYLEGLEVLLETLGSLDASLLDVLVDSRDTSGLVDEKRRVDPGRPYPIRLSLIAGLDNFRRDLTRSVARTAREDDSAGGGNPTKRLRLEVEVPGNPSVEELATRLAGSSPDTILGDPAFEELIESVNQRAREYRFGQLHSIRKDLKGLQRTPGGDIFRDASVHAEEKYPYAFHYGGRTELQFNIGVENRDEEDDLRHGVAFSFDPSQTLPDPGGTLVPKMARFNEFVRLNSDSLSDFRFWWHGDTTSPDEPVRPIPAHLAQPGHFLFMGTRQARESVNVDAILRDFDRLLPLYEFVEGESGFPTQTVAKPEEPSEFRPGHHSRATGSREITRTQRSLELTFRHNELQKELYDRLRDSGDSVGTEQTGLSKDGTSIDVVVSSDDGFEYYEIKTSMSARGCLRQALSQLMEYSYWPGGTEASKLIVVGEPPPDEETRKYVTTLRESFGLPIFYESIAGERV